MRSLASAWPWLPAVVLLALVITLRVDVPYYDSWGFVEAYRDWTNGEYGWKQLFATHGPHPVVTGKLLYWAALHFGGGHVGNLALLAWGITMSIALIVARLIKTQVEDATSQARLIALSNLLLFSPAMESTWLWDFVAFNYIPGLCLAAALACFALGELSWWRWLCGAAACAVGMLSFGSGFLIAWLCSVVVAWRTRSWGRTLAMVGGSVLMMWLAMKFLPSLSDHAVKSAASERAASLAEQPVMTFNYLLMLLGAVWGKGTAADPLWLSWIAGAAQVAAIAWVGWQLWLRRAERELITRAMPWLALCGFAVLNACMIALARMAKSYDTAFAPRYIVFTLFCGVGLVMLMALLGQGKRAWTVLVGVQLLNWVEGAQGMWQFSTELRRDQAALCFAKVLPLTSDRIMQHLGPNSVKGPALFLHHNDKLPGVKLFSDARMVAHPASGEMGKRSSHFDGISIGSDGVLVAYGICEWGKALDVSVEAVVITATPPNAEERMIAFGRASLPTDFLASTLRRHEYDEHYHGWRVRLDQGSTVLAPGTLLRAYGFSVRTGKLRRIAGELPVPAR